MRTFRPTRGLFLGVTGILAAVVAGVLFAVMSWSAGSVELCLALWLFAWLLWVVLLRPCVRLGEREVWVGGSLRTARLPAERIESVSVRQYLKIEVGTDRRTRTYTCAAIGHSRRALGRATQEPLRGLVVDDHQRAAVVSQAERLRELVQELADAAHRRPREVVPAVRSSWDLLPVVVGIALLAGLAVAVTVGAAA